MGKDFAVMDGNEAAARVAFKTNEVIAIYPITPSSPMGELADTWSSQGMTNVWGGVPQIQEMQSEGGAAGAVHGALQAGALTTTFTASQGLLLMLPNMFKIAGELTPAVFHIAARSVATHALSIFGDHSDVMATRSAGWGMLFSNSVQEVHDMALIAQAATLRSRIPFLHIFDGFRTSHEVSKIKLIHDEHILGMIQHDDILAHRQRALSPEHPVLRGTAQNPDVFFQSREATNLIYEQTPEIVQSCMQTFASLTGREYQLFDYVGAQDAERLIVQMGSGAETAEETTRFLAAQGERVGLVKVRLFQPFSLSHFLKALPASTKAIAVLDRTKEPGAMGEPLYQAVCAAIHEGVQTQQAPFDTIPTITGGRYGLGSKEYTPAMVKGILEELREAQPTRHFSVGIVDDVSQRSLPWRADFSTASNDTQRAVFWGLGADGTVGANKNSIKIIGEATDLHVQGYFVYDSKKSGARTISLLRFGTEPIHSTYLIETANFVGIHQFGFLEKYPVLEQAAHGASVLLNCPYTGMEAWHALPRTLQEQIHEKELRLFVIDAYTLARELSLGTRINTIMQACFFYLSEIIPHDQARTLIKEAIHKTYGKRGRFVVKMNEKAVDAAIERLSEVDIPTTVSSNIMLRETVPANAPSFVREVTAEMIAGHGDRLPVSAMPMDGTFPTATTQWEKRNLALEVPVWEEDLCIQCGKCVMICPHSVIRAKRCEPSTLEGAPESFKTAPARWREHKDQRYTLQVSTEDCTGCRLCVEICPVKDKSQVRRKALNMAPHREERARGQEDWDFFLTLPEVPVEEPLQLNKVKDVQLKQPLFEFSGACAGCGETPYLKLLSQLYGDRSVIANATGCSSIYGGNLPTTPWSQNAEGRGPAWSNSLFEDNAEFGLGMRLAIDKQHAYARKLLTSLAFDVGEGLVDAILNAEQSDDLQLAQQRERIATLRQQLAAVDSLAARDLASLADVLVRRDVWIVGGDGWAFDIGYGGLDHVLASGLDVNVLVLDTEVYSNTGGQASKATPLGAVAKFAAGGKRTPKKDLGLLAMSYQSIYVASVVMGADEKQTLRAFREAESFPGPSLLLAYSPCIAHGIDMKKSIEQQRLAVETGYRLLYRYDPRLIEKGEHPLHLDSKAPKRPLKEYLYNELRYRMLAQADPDTANQLLKAAQEDIHIQWEHYQQLANEDVPGFNTTT